MISTYISQGLKSISLENLKSISEQFYSAIPINVVADWAAGKTTIIPLYLMEQLPEDERLYVVVPLRRDARQITEHLSHESGLPYGTIGTLFRPRIISDVVDSPDNRLIYVSAEYFTKTGMGDRVKNVIIDYSLYNSADILVVLSQMSQKVQDGQPINLMVMTAEPLDTQYLWGKGHSFTPTFPSARIRSPESCHWGAKTPTELKGAVFQLIRSQKFNGILVYVETQEIARTLNKELVDYLVETSTDACESFILDSRPSMAEINRLHTAPDVGKIRVVIAVITQHLNLPKLPWVTAVITTGKISEPVYLDYYLYNFESRPLSRSEDLALRRKLNPDLRIPVCYINLERELNDTPFYTPTVSFNTTLRMIIGASGLAIPIHSLTTGVRTRLISKLQKAYRLLETVGLVYTEVDGTLAQTVDGLLVFDGLNLTVRAMAALAQALRVGILPQAFPYIALLSRVKGRSNWISIPSSDGNREASHYTESDPINDLIHIATEYAKHGRAASRDVLAAYAIFERTYRCAIPKGLDIVPNMNDWVSVDGKPPRILEPELLEKMKSVILRAQCDQCYVLKNKQLILSFDDSIPLSKWSHVVPTAEHRIAVAQPASITPSNGGESFVVGRNITIFTFEEFERMLKIIPGSPRAFQSLALSELD